MHLLHPLIVVVIHHALAVVSSTVSLVCTASREAHELLTVHFVLTPVVLEVFAIELVVEQLLLLLVGPMGRLHRVRVADRPDDFNLRVTVAACLVMIHRVAARKGRYVGLVVGIAEDV